MEWDFVRSFQVVMKSFEKTAEEKLFQRWALNYDRECSFDEFKNSLSAASKKYKGIERSAKEILEDVKSILDSASKEEAK